MSRYNKLCFQGFTGFLSVFLLVRWSPEFIQTTKGDPSFTISYHDIFFTGAQYGVDVLHVGGPWSILYYPIFHPDTFVISLIGQIAVAFTLGMVICRTAVEHIIWPIGRIAFVLGMLAFFTVAVDARYFFLALVAIALIPNFRQRRTSPLFLSILLVLALGLLVKSSFFITGTIAFTIIALKESLRDRMLPLHSVIFVIFVTTLLLISGQNLENFSSYVGSIFELGGAYPEFVSELGSYWELLAFWFFAFALVTLILSVDLRRNARWAWITSAAYAAILFVAYKQGFIRQDGQHVIRSFATIFTFGAFFIALNQQFILNFLSGHFAERLLHSRGSVAVWVSCLAAAICSTGYLLAQYPSLYNTKLERLLAQATDLWRFGTTGLETFETRHKEAANRIQKDYPIPDLDGTLAIYSNLQSVAMASPVSYRVLPTTTPQLTWTPRLDAMNAAFISSPDAPKFIAGHLPYTTNRQAALALLKYYRPYGFVSDMYLLERSKKREIKRTTLETRVIEWGKQLRVPETAGGLINVKIRYKRTILGNLLNFFYQTAPVYLVIHGRNGITSRDLIGREIAQHGLLLSPDPKTVPEFAAMTTKTGREYMAMRSAVAIHLEAGLTNSWLFPLNKWGPYFRPVATITFERLRFLDEGERDWPKNSPNLASFRRILNLRPRDPSGQTPDLQLTNLGRVAVPLSVEKPLQITLTPNKRRFEFEIAADDTANSIQQLKIILKKDGQVLKAANWYPPQLTNNPPHASNWRVGIATEVCAGATRCEAIIELLKTGISDKHFVQIVDMFEN